MPSAATPPPPSRSSAPRPGRSPTTTPATQCSKPPATRDDGRRDGARRRARLRARRARRRPPRRDVVRGGAFLAWELEYHADLLSGRSARCSRRVARSTRRCMTTSVTRTERAAATSTSCSATPTCCSRSRPTGRRPPGSARPATHGSRGSGRCSACPRSRCPDSSARRDCRSAYSSSPGRVPTPTCSRGPRWLGPSAAARPLPAGERQPHFKVTARSGAERGRRAEPPTATVPAHDDGDEVARDWREVAVGAGRAEQAVAAAEPSAPTSYRLKFTQSGLMSICIARSAPAATSALARSAGVRRPPAQSSAPLRSTPTAERMVAGPATDPPHAPPTRAAGVGAPLSTSRLQVLAHAPPPAWRGRGRAPTDRRCTSRRRRRSATPTPGTRSRNAAPEREHATREVLPLEPAVERGDEERPALGRDLPTPRPRPAGVGAAGHDHRTHELRVHPRHERAAGRPGEEHRSPAAPCARRRPARPCRRARRAPPAPAPRPAARSSSS